MKFIIKAKIYFIASIVIFLSGCATHGQVDAPALQVVDNPKYYGKVFSTEFLYSQPEPGIFTSGDQLELKPIEEASLSVGSSRVLSRFGEMLKQQLPAEAQLGKKEKSDYTFSVEMIAHDKRGPAFADYEALASFGKSLVTLGLGASEYTIHADFDVTYKLKANNETIFAKSYQILDEIDHERGDFDKHSIGDDLAAQLLEKHIIITMNDYFKAMPQ